MTASSVILGISGIILTFIPQEISVGLGIGGNKLVEFLLQILGGLYFGFAMLNWMTRSGLIGGIYNRPIATANFTHFMISGLALTKGITADPVFPIAIWLVVIIYCVFAVSFGVLLFRHPVADKDPK